MRTKKAIFNSLTSILLQITILIVGIIVPKLFILNYGSAINGLRASVTQFVGYLTIVEVGIGGAIIYSLYKPLASKDYIKINGILSAGRIQYLQAGYIFLLLLLGMIVVYPLLIMDEGIDLYKSVGFIILMSINAIVSYFFTAKYIVLLQANQQPFIVSLVRIITTLLNATILVFLFLQKKDIILSYLIASISILIFAFLIIYITKRKHKYLSFKEAPDLNTKKMRSDVMYHQISSMAIYNTPVILITIFCSLEDMSIYSIYFMVMNGIVGIIASFTNSFSSAFGDIIARNDIRKLYKAYSEYEFLYYIIITIIYSCTSVLFLPFIEIYTLDIKDLNYSIKGYALLFVVFGLLNSLKIPQSTIIISSGHYRETRHRARNEALICILLSIVLVQFYQIYGVLLGSIFGLLYRTVDIFYPYKLYDIPIHKTLGRMTRAILIIVIFYLCNTYVVNVNPTNYYAWILTSLILFICSSFITILVNLLFERQSIITVYNKIKNLVYS